MPIMPITLSMCTLPLIRKIGRQSRLLLALAMCCCGCTSLTEYVTNGFKVGPNYREPAAAVAAFNDAFGRIAKDVVGWTVQTL